MNNSRNSRNPNNNHDLDLAIVQHDSTLPLKSAVPMNVPSTPNISVIEKQAEELNVTPIPNVEEINELGPVEPVAMDGGRRKTQRSTKRITKRSKRGTRRSKRSTRRTRR
jgi:hypothetical protein